MYAVSAVHLLGARLSVTSREETRSLVAELVIKIARCLRFLRSAREGPQQPLGFEPTDCAADRTERHATSGALAILWFKRTLNGDLVHWRDRH